MSSIFRIFLLFVSILSISIMGCRTPYYAKNPDKKEVILTEKDELEFTFSFHNGCKEKLLGNYQAAAEYFYRCIKINKQSAPVYYELAGLYELMGNVNEAVLLSERSVALDSENKWYLQFLANLYVRSRQDKNAQEIYTRLIEKYPSHLDYYNELASLYLISNELEKAIEVYNLMESKIGINEDLIIQKEKIYIKLGDVDKAAHELQKLIKQNPNEVKYMGMLAELYMANDLTDKALNIFNEILEIEPDNPQIHLSLADYYRAIGEKEKSFAELLFAFGSVNLDIDTKVRILLSYYAVTESFTELKDQAFTLADTLVKIHPDNPKSHSIYADFLFRDNQFEKAREEYRKVIDIDKSKFIVWNQLLVIESELGDFEAMFNESKEAIELFPTQPAVYLFNGVAALQTENYEEGINSLKEGVNYIIDNKMMESQFYSYIGDSYHYLEKHQESDTAYGKSLALDPNNAYVLNNWSYYLSERKDSLEFALDMSMKSNELLANNSSFLDTYGWILYQLANYEEARVWLEKAFENGGNTSTTILEHLGDVCYQLGDTDKALEYWQHAQNNGGDSKILERKIKEKKLLEE